MLQSGQVIVSLRNTYSKVFRSLSSSRWLGSGFPSVSKFLLLELTSVVEGEELEADCLTLNDVERYGDKIWPRIGGRREISCVQGSVASLALI